jgi:hypothetical protein
MAAPLLPDDFRKFLRLLNANGVEYRAMTQSSEPRPLPRRTEELRRLVDEGRVIPARRPSSALPEPLRLTLDRAASTVLVELREASI